MLVKNDHDKRCFWKLAKIVELYKGEDQCIRAAKLQVEGEDKRIFNRALKHLILLEIRRIEIAYYAEGFASKK